MQLTWIVALLFAALIALFAVQNTTAVNVSILFWSINQVSVAVLILATAVVGALITVLAGIPRLVRDRLRLRALRKQLRQAEQHREQLEAELSRYQNRPVVRSVLPT